MWGDDRYSHWQQVNFHATQYQLNRTNTHAKHCFIITFFTRCFIITVCQLNSLNYSELNVNEIDYLNCAKIRDSQNGKADALTDVQQSNTLIAK